MTSLAPGNAKFKKDRNESSPAKRSLSRKQSRKKTSQRQYREGLKGVSDTINRPKTSFSLNTLSLPMKNSGEMDNKLHPLFRQTFGIQSPFLVQSIAERMPWPHMPRGREPNDPTAPIKAYTIDENQLKSFNQSRSSQLNTLQPEELKGKF